ncbi:MAG: DUF4416 family protein [SAR324 cluster bacterium]|nr:DUF4416 family protein [SAR324 cluster bacterium]
MIKEQMHMYGKRIAGFIFSCEDVLHAALEMLIQETEEVQLQSNSFSFHETSYYQAEMGDGLKRLFVSFVGLVSLEQIHLWKKLTDTVEDSFRVRGNREINIDPGYLDFHKVVLLSSKYGGQKIYLGQQVWADMVLLKKKGGYQHFAWTFPDLRAHKYDEFFLKVRADLKNFIKTEKRNGV